MGINQGKEGLYTSPGCVLVRAKAERGVAVLFIMSHVYMRLPWMDEIPQMDELAFAVWKRNRSNVWCAAFWNKSLPLKDWRYYCIWAYFLQLVPKALSLKATRMDGSNPRRNFVTSVRAHEDPHEEEPLSTAKKLGPLSKCYLFWIEIITIILDGIAGQMSRWKIS